MRRLGVLEIVSHRQVFKKSVGDYGEITLSGFKSIVQSKNVSPLHIVRVKLKENPHKTRVSQS